MTLRNSSLLTIIVMIFLTFSIPLSANVSIIRDNPKIEVDKLNQKNESNIESSNAIYTGTIKVHIIEPVSRWNDLRGYAYENAHLWYPLLGSLSIPDATVWDTTITWDGTAKGFPNVTPENIGAAVAVFNSTDEVCDAYPPNGYYYVAHYADASAIAHPDEPGMNQTSAGFTHSVYIEEGSATW